MTISRTDPFTEFMRRIVAWVEVDGKERLMTFLTNHLTWSARSVAELYRCRWGIEVFFKQIKQTLQLADFLGTSANAVRWQIWTALLVYLLLRYLAFLSNWAHSSSRLFAMCARAYGASGTYSTSWRAMGQPEAASVIWIFQEFRGWVWVERERAFRVKPLGRA